MEVKSSAQCCHLLIISGCRSSSPPPQIRCLRPAGFGQEMEHGPAWEERFICWL